MKSKKIMLAIAFLSSFIFLGNSTTVNAKTYSNSQLRKYAIKTMNKHHLLGTIEIVKDGHRQTVNVGYGYYRRKIKNGNKKLLYPVGSLQKSITAAIITQLIYQKKFSQNTKISETVK
ncbi:hypothetical protein Lh8105_06660 [Lactobacillus helveticus]|uniref:Beta-lactamase-related domain-containing protein n=1 Tax=Lactobacillus helveticus TaxID=1587 RepID=A0AAU8XUL2_LACHE|nr:hypothetical protein Lh8105_06660 [Lactobacillus helveticus]